MNKEATDGEEIEHGVEKEILNEQQPQWERVFSNNCSRFGDEPSYPARKATALFEKEGKKRKFWNLEGGRVGIPAILPAGVFQSIRLSTLKAGQER